jgi:exopolysaccharide production protein ExoZ
LKKLQNIQALRGIAVLSVVLYHLLTVEEKYGGSQTILSSLFQFGMFGVDLFFVISGFVMISITRGKFQCRQEVLRFFYHRVARIYPTYWVYTFLVLGVFLIKPSWVNSSQGNQVDILASFLLLPSQTLPLIMVGWTLIHEMYFYLIFTLILMLVPEKKILLAISLWAFTIIFMNLFLASNTPTINIITHPLTLEFIGGCYLAIIYYRKNTKIKVRTLLISAFLISLIALYAFQYYQSITGNIEPQGWWRVLIFGIPAMLLVYCFTNAERSGYIIHSSLVKVGDASYSIYLSHILTLNVIGRVWSIFSINERSILRTGLVFYFSEITKVMISRGGFNETQVKRRV